MATSGLENLKVGIERLLNEIDTEIESERRDTTTLEQLEQTIDVKRHALVQKGRILPKRKEK